MRRFYILNFIVTALLLFPIAATAQTFTKVEGTPFVGLNLADVEWGDYDNDGDLDIISTGGSEDGLLGTCIYRHESDNQFVLAVQLPGAGLGCAKWGDIDNDGDLDFFIAGNINGSAGVALYRNNGNDNFTSLDFPFDRVYYAEAQWGDIDNDGDIDLIYTGNSFNNIVTNVLLNDGTGVFSKITHNIPGVYHASIDLADYDNDNDLDISICGKTSSGIITKIFKNNGGNNFEDLGLNFQGVFDGGIKWGDYDNDNNLDLMFAGTNSSSYYSKIYRNEGNDIFTDVNISLADMAQGSVNWIDIDDDNDLDIILSNTISFFKPIKIYRNVNGNFDEFAHLLPSIFRGDIDVADYDLDGDEDIILVGATVDGSYICELYQNNLYSNLNCLADATITVSDATATLNTNFTIPITTTEITADCNMSAFQFVVTYDASKMDYVGFNQAGTLSEGSMVVVNSNTAGVLNVVMASANSSVAGVGSLIDLEFTATSCESSTIEISDFYYNTESNTNLVNGTVTVSSENTISIADAIGIVSRTFTTSVSSDEIFASCGNTSFQFELAFDATHLDYAGYDLAGTLDPLATVTVDNSTSGILLISATTSTALSGLGDLIKLQFTPISRATSSLHIQNFVLGGTPVSNMFDGTVTSHLYGDVNGDGMIMAMDATLVLMYAVGSSTENFGVPMPWQPWQLIAGNVDGIGSINAFDGSLILQYSAGLITEFPVENMKKSGERPVAEIEILKEGNNIVFYNKEGALYGFDLVSVEGTGAEQLGNAQKLHDSWLMVANRENGSYKVALASSKAIGSGKAFLNIPAANLSSDLTFNMLVNGQATSMTLKAGTTALEELPANISFTAYPNPVNDQLNLKFSLQTPAKVSLRIFDNNGKLINQLENTTLSEGEYNYKWDCGGLTAGIYHVEYINDNKRIVEKIIIK